MVDTWSIPVPYSAIPGVLFVYNLVFCKIVQTQLVVEKNLVHRGMPEIAEAIVPIFLVMMTYHMYKNPYPKKNDPVLVNS